MFLHNTFMWPWTRIAALIAPRPLLFVNSDHDSIFPMDANERISNRLERLYSLFGAGDVFDTLVSIGGHAYRKDIRQGAYRFINTYLKNDPRHVEDTERDLVTRLDGKWRHPIPPEELRVFPKDEDLPEDELNSRIDRFFVPRARVDLPRPGGFKEWKETLLRELKRVTFRAFPEKVEWKARIIDSARDRVEFRSEPGIRSYLERKTAPSRRPGRLILVIDTGEGKGEPPPELKEEIGNDDAVYLLSPRGIGPTRWTRRNPPNYVERSHVLLGRTVSEGRIRDAVAAAAYLKKRYASPVWTAGRGGGAVLAAYAALLSEAVDGTIALRPPESHMDSNSPALLNVLRVCDIPEVLGMLAPRPLRVTGMSGKTLNRIKAIYNAAGAGNALR